MPVVKSNASYKNLWDTHAHLDKYDMSAWPEIQSICEANQIKLFGVSMDIPEYQKIKSLAEQYSFIIPWFGIHPWKADQYVKQLSDVDKYLQEAPFIGEIGLDKRFLDESPAYLDQLKVFEYQITHAAVKNKWVNLHTSGAEQDILKYLQQYHPNKNIIHWYHGPIDLIKPLLTLECYFTVPLEIIFSDSIKRIIKAIPLNRLLLETDNPGGWPWLLDIYKQPTQKETAMPSLIFELVPIISEIKHTSTDKVIQQIQMNQHSILL